MRDMYFPNPLLLLLFAIGFITFWVSYFIKNGNKSRRVGLIFMGIAILGVLVEFKVHETHVRETLDAIP